MSEESVIEVKKQELKKQISERKKKIKNLKKLIENAKGTDAGKQQAEYQKSVEKNAEEIKGYEAELSVLESEEVSSDDVLDMIKDAANLNELDDLKDKLPDEAPKEVIEAIVKREQELTKSPKAPKVQSGQDGLEWKVYPLDVILEAQKEFRLIGHDPLTNLALIRHKG